MIINDFYQILYLKLSFLYTVQSISVGEAEAEEQGEPHKISESYQVVCEFLQWFNNNAHLLCVYQLVHAAMPPAQQFEEGSQLACIAHLHQFYLTDQDFYCKY